MTVDLQEAVARLRELPDTVQNAAVQAILRNIEEHRQTEELDVIAREALHRAVLIPLGAKYDIVDL